MNKMKMNVFHTFRIKQERQVSNLSNSLRASIQNSIPEGAKIEKIENEFFIYSTGSGKKVKFYKVPTPLNEYGIKEFDYTQQREVFKKGTSANTGKKVVTAMDDPASQPLRDAASNYVNNLTQGENAMNTVEPLLPPGNEKKKEMTATELQTMQEEADKRGILLPCEFNRATEPKQKQKWTGPGVEPLLPAGVGN